MKTSAHTFSEHLWLIAVGVNSYSSDRVQPLSWAERNAQAIAEAFRDSHIGGVPPNHVQLLTGPRATRDHVITVAKEITEVLQEEDILIFYFCGHGDTDDNDLYLCTTDVQQNDMPGTAISGSCLNQIFGGQFRAAGLVVLLDCCNSGRFAAHAPDIFRTPSAVEFRIMLSSAGAEEASWEIPNIGPLFTHYILRIIRGEDIVGSERPGLIYLSDLWRYLQSRIAYEYESRLKHLPKQIPVQVGLQQVDPLILVNRDLTFRNISIRTVRYSRRDVYRLFLRLSLLIAMFAVFVFGVLYTYCDHLEFVRTEGSELVSYRGHPSISWLATKRLWSIQINRLFFRESSPLRMEGGTLKGAYGNSVTPMISAELRPGFKWALFTTSKQRLQAVSDLKGAIHDKDLAEEVKRQPTAIDLLTRNATLDDVPSLQSLASSPLLEARSEILGILLRLEPSEAYRQLTKREFESEALFHELVLNEMRGSCNGGIHDYLKWLISQRVSTSVGLAQFIDAALRVGCRLSADELLDLNRSSAETFLDVTDNRDVATFAVLQNDIGFRKAVLRYLQMHAPVGAPYPTAEVGIFGRLPKGTCAPEFWKYLANPFPYIQIEAAHALIQQCDDAINRVRAHFTELPADIVLQLARQQKISTRELLLALNRVEENRDATSLRRDLVIKAIGLLPPKDIAFAVPVLSKYLDARYDTSTRIEAIRSLIASHSGGDRAQVLLSDQNESVRREAYRWLCDISPSTCKMLLLRDLGREHVPFLPELLGRLALSENELALLQSKLAGNTEERHHAAAVLAMRGSADTAMKLLTAEDTLLRKTASQYLAYNPDFEDICAAVEEFGNPSDITYTLERQLEMLHSFKEDVDHVPQSTRAWRAQIIIKARQELGMPEASLPAGIRLRLEDWIAGSQKSN